ncbi:sensor histidine kinase [Hoyosella sp. YIM 151337]|uniref:ATP-binding protein n=1 Tax=Hoyosella sp. YIM 151337 TaxID=2992742 RepID=UPI0022367012|nr:sensor histidine kinase [Hoyosella sp. YIM 151337]MCW4352097.1 sensor histidine kinase [Hoyosella sp. YIM 151337]
MRMSLTRYLFILNTVLLTTTVVVLGGMWFAHHQRMVQNDMEERAMTMAQSVAAMPDVKEMLADTNRSQELATLAENLRHASGFEYIVVADREGIRHSHPVPSAIGQPTSVDPSAVLAGETWTGVERGPAGVTLRARAPIFGADENESGTIGYVSVGILASDIAGNVSTALLTIGGTVLVVLAGGAIGAYVISRRIRSRIYGLEPHEIAELLDNREALLYAISEGVLAVGSDGKIVLANAAARDLLGLHASDIGDTPESTGISGELRDLLESGEPVTDRLIALDDRILVCSRRPVRVRDADGGIVVTLRDQTEMTKLSDELDGARTVTRGLQAQRHEFANRIHTVAGMLELGAVDRAKAYLTGLSTATIRANSEVSVRIADITLSALILAKSVQAAEQGTTFEVSPMSHLADELDDRLRADVLLVVGNLVDNALEATGEGEWVELLVRHHVSVEGELMGDIIEVRVTDSGPGVAPDFEERIFSAGFSTKEMPGSERRGLGLALVRQACKRWGGKVVVESAEETVFSAYLPTRRFSRGGITSTSEVSQ